MRLLLVLLNVLVIAHGAFAWQDDVDVFAYDPRKQMASESGFGFLSGASAHMRMARYLFGDRHHGWRGAADGDVALLNFGTQGLWHFGLNVETLVDDLNDIHFRLVQVYYQALTRISWQFPSSVLHVGIRHRCSHGVDGAVQSRILIRSGLTASYHWYWYADKFTFDVVPGFNLYLLGQNKDLATQQRGNINAHVQGAWLVAAPMWMVVAVGTTLELVGNGDNWVYSIASPLRNARVEPLFGGRVAVRIKRGAILSEIGVQFSQILDNGYYDEAKGSNNLSFNLDFAW